MGFDALTSVTALDYDFTNLRNCPEVLKKAKGVIPEPSTDQINRFAWAMRDFFMQLARIDKPEDEAAEKPEAEDTPDDEPEVDDKPARYGSVAEALEGWRARRDLKDDDRKLAEEAIAELIVEVCSKEFTVEQILALPGRVRSAFIEWLNGELLVGKERLTAMYELLEETPSE